MQINTIFCLSHIFIKEFPEYISTCHVVKGKHACTCSVINDEIKADYYVGVFDMILNISSTLKASMLVVLSTLMMKKS